MPDGRSSREPEESVTEECKQPLTRVDLERDRGIYPRVICPIRTLYRNVVGTREFRFQHTGFVTAGSVMLGSGQFVSTSSVDGVVLAETTGCHEQDTTRAPPNNRRRNPADTRTERTIKSMSFSTGPRRGFTFTELIAAMLIAGFLALVAVQMFGWLVDDTKTKIVRLDANEFERNVRSLANTELRSPTAADATIVAEQMTADEEGLDIDLTGSGYELTRTGQKACVVIGTGVNTPGTVTDGPCN